jgi:ribosomal protein S18 acetylase RimI-like enzyme
VNAVIRSAVVADLPAILPMVKSLCDLHQSWDPLRYGFLPDVVDRYASWLPQRIADERSVVLVAAANGVIVGLILGEVLDEIPIYKVREYGFVHDTWVEPPCRGQGIARALAAELVASFARMGVGQIRLDTATANDAARRLFASVGFVASTVQMLRQG